MVNSQTTALSLPPCQNLREQMYQGQLNAEGRRFPTAACWAGCSQTCSCGWAASFQGCHKSLPCIPPPFTFTKEVRWQIQSWAQGWIWVKIPTRDGRNPPRLRQLWIAGCWADNLCSVEWRILKSPWQALLSIPDWMHHPLPRKIWETSGWVRTLKQISHLGPLHLCGGGTPRPQEPMPANPWVRQLRLPTNRREIKAWLSTSLDGRAASACLAALSFPSCESIPWKAGRRASLWEVSFPHAAFSSTLPWSCWGNLTFMGNVKSLWLSYCLIFFID